MTVFMNEGDNDDYKNDNVKKNHYVMSTVITIIITIIRQL
jgi:hypothetical protein